MLYGNAGTYWHARHIDALVGRQGAIALSAGAEGVPTSFKKN